MYGLIRVPGSMFAETGTVSLAAVWTYVGIALLYAICCATPRVMQA